MNEHMQSYIRTVVLVVQAIFVLAGGGFALILIPELYRLYTEQSWAEFRQYALIGGFATVACIAGLIVAELVKRRFLSRG